MLIQRVSKDTFAASLQDAFSPEALEKLYAWYEYSGVVYTFDPDSVKKEWQEFGGVNSVYKRYHSFLVGKLPKNCMTMHSTLGNSTEGVIHVLSMYTDVYALSNDNILIRGI